MPHPYHQFLPLEIQASIDALRELDDPAARDAELDQLTERILKASEAKTTSLQLDLERIEHAFDRRFGMIEDKLIVDNQSRTSEIYQMVSDSRGALLALQVAFSAGRDHAADERARLETKINGVVERVERIEQALEIEPATSAGDGR